MPRGRVANGPDKGAYIDYPGTIFNIAIKPVVPAVWNDDEPVRLHQGFNSYKFNGSMWVHMPERQYA